MTSDIDSRAPDRRRRRLLLGATATVEAGLATPAVLRAQGAATTWRIHTIWEGGTGLAAFREWCHSMAGKSGGRLAFEPIANDEGLDGVGQYRAVQSGRFEAVNAMLIEVQDVFPAAAFLTSFPLGLRNAAEFDTFYHGLGGIAMAREIWAPEGLVFVGPVNNSYNLLHTTRPIYSSDMIRRMVLRMEPGMGADLMAELGAEIRTMDGGEMPAAMTAGTITGGIYENPTANGETGILDAGRFISVGPPGMPSVFQPVDMMDLTVSAEAWARLSPDLRQLVEDELRSYSILHLARIMADNEAALRRFEGSGGTIVRMDQADAFDLTRLAIPIWQKYAARDEASRRVFEALVRLMASPALGYVEPAMADFMGVKL